MGAERLFTEEKFHSEIKFTLHNPEVFYPTGYWVLESQAKNGFIPCAKVISNGETQLVYDISGYQSFQEMLPDMSPVAFRTVVGNLMKQIGVIRDIGFLECEFIFMDLSHIFVDINNRGIALIYLPVTTAETMDRLPLFQKKLIELLVKTAQSNTNVLDKDTVEFLARLGPDMMQQDQKEQHERPVQAVLKSNSYAMDDIVINKPEFLLGRSAAKADGVISGNGMVGREHCKIIQRDGQYLVVDLQSTNGTVINQGPRLNSNQAYPLKSGDRIAMANVEFTFLILSAGA